MSLTTRKKGLIHGGRGFGGYIRVENALLIWGAYIRGSLYTGEGEGGGGLIYRILRYFTMANQEPT